MSVYLDNAATTRVCPEAARAAQFAMTECWGNPSSQHALGFAAAKLLEDAREGVAGALGCPPETLYFTSGGTESDNWALLKGAEAARHAGRHVISSPAEHDAVRRSLDALEGSGFQVTRLKPEPDGSVAVSRVLEAFREDTCLISLMLVNNETGGVTDIPALSRALKARGSRALLHTDAVQGFLKRPFTAESLGADLVTVSGHKLHAPKGVGALYIRRGLHLQPLILGGGQEREKRSGTEALPAIAAFGAACRLGMETAEAAISRMAALKVRIRERVLNECDGAFLIDSAAPHILCLSLPGNKSEHIINLLNRREVYISRGSACKKGRRSHVLESIGLSAGLIDGAVRVSLSRYSTPEEAEALCDGLRDARKSLFRAR